MDENESKIDYEYRKERYEAYVKERDALRNDALQISDRYDKAILALGGGSLALSVTFLEKIAPHPTPWTFIVLAVSWLSLIASVLFELFALSASQTAINEGIEQAEYEYNEYLRSLPEAPKEDDTKRKRPDPELYVKRVRLWNRLSIWLLTGGIGLLCLFSVLNLPWKTGKHHEQQIKAIK